MTLLEVIAGALGVATPSAEVLGRVIATRAPANPIDGAVWRAVARSLHAETAALFRLAHAVARGVGTAADLSTEDAAAFALPPPGRRRYAVNEHLPDWLRSFARIAGVERATIALPWGPEIDIAHQEHAKTRSEAYAAANLGVDHEYDRRARLEEALKNADAALASKLENIAHARGQQQTQRSESIDRVRLAVRFLLTRSLDTRPLRGIERLAVWELVMHTSGASVDVDGYPLRTALDIPDAVAIAMSGVTMTSKEAATALADVAAFLAAPQSQSRATFRIAPRLAKSARRGGHEVTQRRRGRFVFGVEPETIDATASELEELRRDDGLEEVHTLTRIAELEDGVASRNARISELEAQLSQRDAAAPARSKRDRTQPKPEGKS